MIYDSLKHLEQYEGTFPRLYRGLELLRTTDFSTLEDKLYEVEGRDLFFSLQSYDSSPPTTPLRPTGITLISSFWWRGRKRSGLRLWRIWWRKWKAARTATFGFTADRWMKSPSPEIGLPSSSPVTPTPPGLRRRNPPTAANAW